MECRKLFAFYFGFAYHALSLVNQFPAQPRSQSHAVFPAPLSQPISRCKTNRDVFRSHVFFVLDANYLYCFDI